MDVAFALAGAGHLDEGRLRAHGLDGGAAHIAHGGAQTTGQLMHHARQRAAHGDTPFDAFWHQLVGIGSILEITILAALFHRTQATHAAIALVAAALEQFDFTGRLFSAGKQATNHHRGCARNNRLANIPRIADAAISNQRDAVLQGISHHVDGGDLRHAHAGHDAGGANGAGAHADLHCIRACVHQRQCGIASDDIAANHLHLREGFLDPVDAIQHALRMAMRGVHHDHIHAGRHQGFHALLGIATHTHRCAHQQAFAEVIGGVGVVGFLLDVFDRDQPAQCELVIDHQHFFDAVLVQQAHHFIVTGTFLHGDQTVTLGHHVADRVVELLFKAHVATGDDAHQVARVIHHRHAGNIARAGEFEHLADGGVRSHRERVADDPSLKILDPRHLLRLRLRGHVFVDDGDAAQLRHRHRKARLANGIHRRRHNR